MHNVYKPFLNLKSYSNSHILGVGYLYLKMKLQIVLLNGWNSHSTGLSSNWQMVVHTLMRKEEVLSFKSSACGHVSFHSHIYIGNVYLL